MAYDVNHLLRVGDAKTIHDAVQGQVDDLKSAFDTVRSIIAGASFPWEIGGAAVAGFTKDNKRLRLAVTLNAPATVIINSTTQMVVYVYDATTKAQIDGESVTSWSTGTFTVKAGRLFRVALRKSDNSVIASGDRAGLISGITFIVGGFGSEIIKASRDNSGELYPSLSETLSNMEQNLPVGADFSYALVSALKYAAYMTDGATALIEAVANALTETVATIYDFEPRIGVSNSAAYEYMGGSATRIITRRRYFPIDNRFSYVIDAGLNTLLKSWVSVMFLNATAVTAIEAGNNYSDSDTLIGSWTEFVDGKYSFDPSGVSVNGKPVAGIRISLAFGDTHSDNVSVLGDEVEWLKIKRTVKV